MEKDVATKKPIYKKWWFWLIVVVVVGGIGSAAGLGGDTGENPSATTEPAVAEPENSADDKETAKDFDFEVWDQCVDRADANYDLLLDAEDASSLSEMYSTFDGVQEQCWAIGDVLDEIDVDVTAEDEAEEYLENVDGYVSCISVAASSFMDYIDGGDMDDLNSASESLSAAEFARGESESSREAFLKASGFSADEISEILSE